MLDLNIVIDLVHIGEKGYWEILELADKPVILSHSTPTMFPNTSPDATYLMNGKVPRPKLELSRDRAALKALAKNGGCARGRLAGDPPSGDCLAFQSLDGGLGAHLPAQHRDHPRQDGTARYDDVWGG